MPQPEAIPGIDPLRTGPVYVRLDYIPLLADGLAVDQEEIKEDMYNQVSMVLGFEDVHIYSLPMAGDHMGYALFVFSTETAAFFGFRRLIQTFEERRHVIPWWPQSLTVLRRPGLMMPAERARRLKDRAEAEHLHAGPLIRGVVDEKLPAASLFASQQGQSEGPKPPADEGSSSSGPPSLPDTLPELASLAGTEVEAIITEEVPPPPPPPDPPNEKYTPRKLEEPEKPASVRNRPLLLEPMSPPALDMEDDRAASDWQPPLPEDAPPSPVATEVEDPPPLPASPPPDLATPVPPLFIPAGGIGQTATGAAPVEALPHPQVHPDTWLPPHLSPESCRPPAGLALRHFLQDSPAVSDAAKALPQHPELRGAALRATLAPGVAGAEVGRQLPRPPDLALRHFLPEMHSPLPQHAQPMRPAVQTPGPPSAPHPSMQQPHLAAPGSGPRPVAPFRNSIKYYPRAAATGSRQSPAPASGEGPTNGALRREQVSPNAQGLSRSSHLHLGSTLSRKGSDSGAGMSVLGRDVQAVASEGHLTAVHAEEVQQSTSISKRLPVSSEKRGDRNGLARDSLGQDQGRSAGQVAKFSQGRGSRERESSPGANGYAEGHAASRHDHRSERHLTDVAGMKRVREETPRERSGSKHCNDRSPARRSGSRHRSDRSPARRSDSRRRNDRSPAHRSEARDRRGSEMRHRRRSRSRDRRQYSPPRKRPTSESRDDRARHDRGSHEKSRFRPRADDEDRSRSRADGREDEKQQQARQRPAGGQSADRKSRESTQNTHRRTQQEPARGAHQNGALSQQKHADQHNGNSSPSPQPELGLPAERAEGPSRESTEGAHSIRDGSHIKVKFHLPCREGTPPAIGASGSAAVSPVPTADHPSSNFVWSSGHTLDSTPEASVVISQQQPKGIKGLGSDSGASAAHYYQKTPEETGATAKPSARSPGTVAKRDAKSLGSFAKLDQEVCQLLGDVLRSSQGLLRKEHFTAQALNKLAELPPIQGKLVLRNIQKRNWTGVQDVAQAIWVVLIYATWGD